MRICPTLLSSLALFSWLGAAEVSNKPTPIRNLTDAREVQTINDNFNRLIKFGVAVTSFGVTVPAALSRTTVTLPTPQPDLRYIITVSPAWQANTRVLFKGTTQFILEYTPPMVQTSLDYFLAR